MKCEKCNTEMIYKQEEHSLLWLCPNCNWGIATTYNSPIELDTTDYTLHVISQHDLSINKIKCISKTFNCNFIKSKQSLLNGTISITDKAPNIVMIKDELDQINIKYHITPEFPY